MTINAKRHLEALCGQLTLGAAIRSIRLADGESQTAYAKKIKVSTQYLCDLEHNRKVVSAKKAKQFAEILGHSPAQFIALAIQDSLKQDGISMLVDIQAA